MYRNKYQVIIPFLLPPLLLYAIFVLYPYGRAMYVSLTQWRGLARAPEFIGLGNFERMLTDDNFWNALGNNAFYLIALPLVTVTLSLAFAFLFTQGVPFASFYRVTYFFPQVMSIVAIGVLWSFIYNPSIGIINSLLKTIGIADPPVWLGNPDTVLWAVGGVVVWQAIGFYMVLFIAGMESIPEAYYEAARIDGASRWRLFRSITVPLMWETIQTGLIFLAIAATNMFAITQTMTQGGPNRASEVLSTYLYDEAFQNSQFGYATAIAVSLFAIILSLSILLRVLTQREAVEY